MTVEIHPHFRYWLDMKDQPLIDLYTELRSFVMDLYPDSNELLYHTHALTSVYSISDKLSDGFCMIPIYTDHLNLGFHRGTLLPDQNTLLKGTGKLIRHIPIKRVEDFKNDPVENLIKSAIEFAIEDMGKPVSLKGLTISKIKS